MRRRVLWGLVILCILSSTACGNRVTAVPEEDSSAYTDPMILDYNFGPDPLVFDPTFVTNRSSMEVASQLFEGLTTFDPQSGAPVPALATEWDASGDGLIYTFRMREDVYWVNQDGEPQAAVNARDVTFAIKRACHPDTPAPRKQVLFIIKGCREVNLTEGIPDIDSVGVRAIEPFTVEFTLNQPAAYLPAILGLPVAWPLPQEAVEQLGPDWSQPEQLLTNGPFLLASLSPNSSVTLEKNPHYPGSEAIKIARVNGRLVDDATAVTLYHENQLDTARIPAGALRSILNDESVGSQLSRVPAPCTVGYGFTMVKSPLDHPRVRRALAHAIDREWLVENMLGAEKIVAHHFTPPTVFGTPSNGNVGIAADATKAQSLLAEAGYPGGSGLPSITLMYPEGEEEARVAVAVAEMWKTVLQIDVILEAEPRATYLETIRSITPLDEMPHAWLLYWCGEYPDAHDWLYEIFHIERSTQPLGRQHQYAERITVYPGGNHVRRAPSEFDELVEEAAGIPDPDARGALYEQAEQLLLGDEVALAPIYHDAINVLTKPWLERYFFAMAGPSFERWEVDMVAKLERSTSGTPQVSEMP